MPAPPLTIVTTGSSIATGQHNEVTRFLQPSAGDTVTGSFDITFWASATGQSFGFWLPLAQRTSIPASGTATPALPGGLSYVGTTVQGTSGMKILFSTTAAANNIGVTGTYIIQY